MTVSVHEVTNICMVHVAGPRVISLLCIKLVHFAEIVKHQINYQEVSGNIVEGVWDNMSFDKAQIRC